MTTTETQQRGTAGGSPTPSTAAPAPDPTVPVAGPSGEAGDDAGAAAGPVTPMTSLRRHWVVGTVLVVAGTALGAGAGALLPPEYTAEARVAVGSNDLTALAIPGYAYGAQELAASTSRYVGNAQVLGELDPVLGGDAASVTGVSASPLPDSSIIRVEVTAVDAETAVRGTDALTTYLLEQADRVNSSTDTDELLEEFSALSRQVAEAEAARTDAAAALAASPAGSPAREAAREALVEGEASVDVLTAQQSALGARYEQATTASGITYQLRVVAGAALSSDTRTAAVQRYGVLGAGVGGLAALIVAVLLDRRRRRPA